MWHGWNSLKEVDINPQQKVFYMQHIKLPPTRNDVVKETLRRSQIVASECNEPYALVTYDLAVAKIAKQIQATEKPLFDNVFIMLRSFIKKCLISAFSVKLLKLLDDHMC